MEGPLKNLADGRILLQLENTNAIPDPSESHELSPLTIDLAGVGDIYLGIPAGGVQVNLVGPPLKGLNKILGAR